MRSCPRVLCLLYRSVSIQRARAPPCEPIARILSPRTLVPSYIAAEGAVVLNVKAARPAFQIALDGAISGSSGGSAGAGRSARAPGAAGGGAATGGAGGGTGAIEESKADGEVDVARGDVSRSSGVASQAITAASFGGTPGGARGGAFGDASLASPARGMGAGAEGSGSGGGLR